MLINPCPVLYIPHGGGPLPLLGDPDHQALVNFLQEIPKSLNKPKAILVISAHWEAALATITSGNNPPLIYDYYGFPAEAYKISYPVAGEPILANKIYQLLEAAGINCRLDAKRGFDHGLFVPLKIMFPDADIPCVQLSLLSSLDPEAHIRIGQALAALRKENLLIIGSGFSFHNMQAFFSTDKEAADAENQAFQEWLSETCCNADFSTNERAQKLIAWRDAPFADFCHPRAEHLIPLLICAGLCNASAKRVFNDKVIGKQATAFLWTD
jgi:aromatic ring-opening dioxygenase catalytic subunit (LigB family)